MSPRPEPYCYSAALRIRPMVPSTSRAAPSDADVAKAANTLRAGVTRRSRTSVGAHAAAPGARHDIDGLSGSTLTARGVTNLVQFWLGANGFQPFLENLKAGEA